MASHLCRICQDEFCSKSLEQYTPLQGHRSRHGQHQFVPLCSSNESKPNPCIATGGLHQRCLSCKQIHNFATRRLWHLAPKRLRLQLAEGLGSARSSQYCSDTWFNEAFAFRIFNHIQSNSVFHTAARLQDFQLCCYAGTPRWLQLVQVDQRRVSNEFCHAFGNL